MNFTDIVHRWLAQTHNFFLTISEWSLDQIDRTVDLLVKALFVNIVMMAFGLILEAIGFRADWSPLLSLGHFLVAFAGALSAGLWLYTWTRVWVLVQAAVKANEVTSTVVREVSRPLPNTPIAIPQLITQELADRTLQGVMAGLAGVAFGSMYAGFFPVYTNLAAFLVIITAGFVVGFATYNPAAKASATLRKWLVPIALGVIVINTALCIFPYDAERFTRLSNAEGRSGRPVIAAQEKMIDALQQERVNIITKAATGTGHRLTPDDQKQLEEISDQIQDIRYPLLKQIGGFATPSLPRMNKKNLTTLMLLAFVGGLVLLIASRTKKAH